MLSKLIVEKNAHIYVSGRAKLMPKYVEKAFTEILSKYLEKTSGAGDGAQMIK